MFFLYFTINGVDCHEAHQELRHALDNIRLYFSTGFIEYARIRYSESGYINSMDIRTVFDTEDLVKLYL